MRHHGVVHEVKQNEKEVAVKQLPRIHCAVTAMHVCYAVVTVTDEDVGCVSWCQCESDTCIHTLLAILPQLGLEAG